MSKHSYGCRVIQRILECGTPIIIKDIMCEFMEQIPELAKDQFGNYVIQHVLDHGSHE